ncbi:MAG: cell division protein FtsZ, partial [Paraglaciecola sp.]|nr:cell division protein FtsZ [Paraglaciecola sp.]
VGNAVKAFASENATVVIGTVIDMDMTDELRVTVVATGIGTERKPDISLVSNRAPRVTHEHSEFRLTGTGAPVASNSITSESLRSSAQEDKHESGSDLEYLDIPAFLRKQAD